MRISDQMMYQSMTQNIDQAQAAYVKTQQEASSGLSISQPSDNPAGTAVVLNLQAAQSQVQSFQSNAQAAQSQMTTADQTLSQLQSVVTSAMSLANQGLSGSATATDMGDMSQQAGGLVSQFGTLANTTYAGQYVFSGTAQQAPLSGSSNTPSSEQTAGTFTSQSVEIGAGVMVPTSVNATSVLGGPQYASGTQVSTMPQWAQQYATAHGDVTSSATPPQTTTTALTLSIPNILSSLQSDLAAGNTAAVEADLGALQAQAGNLNSVRAALGANMNRVQAAISQLTTTSTTLQTQQGNVENVNMAQIITQLTAQQTAYQAAVAAGANLKLPTLANYLT
ncbi:MAG: flagellar hook-associated protein FlgL [Thermaerobacter sp.]|nr:flagellar hook-associated protein FlgL [Thermaerobacter sp.]